MSSHPPARLTSSSGSEHADAVAPPPAKFYDALQTAHAALPALLSHQLVYDFLCLEGFPDVAAILAQEAGLPSMPAVDSPVDSSVDVRARARAAVQSGDIKSAISLVNSFDPSLLEENRELLLRLQLQRFVELLRQGDSALHDALAFAQETLATLVQENPEFLPSMERCMSLLALEDPLTSPHAHLMHVSHRAELSRDLNAAILTLQCKPSTSCISNILNVSRYNSWLKAATRLSHADVAPDLNEQPAATATGGAAAAAAEMTS